MPKLLTALYSLLALLGVVADATVANLCLLAVSLGVLVLAPGPGGLG